jgi:hypothetical protein
MQKIVIDIIIALVVVTAIWVFFGTAWGIVSLVFALQLGWSGVTNDRLDRLEAQLNQGRGK